ncbi:MULTISPECIES: HlyD family secretion protein [Legionella]|uniref:HlyD family efflux transporter periplasmic adaptor subunit n=1 Tax=Legionella septentrionalis TaxID=2498109 RepID=A0A433JMC1_9GAMM|nr:MULTISPECIES: HlyD family efflux transporter periplasmic adaptor subunit [Legionella]MCP0914740.1 HlyD family efflux transporter periplasmic adaptor subunit [Legionella sp. 27cVA30]RUQ91117.1 HlyD family efflux transporter periplasmic adaptor subunit [Legionella septentrionalis]RUR02814.1 HlyD family efflux transporter periplasmic adaptor subunit [Legionella septentrionalis]RUR11412.1 HlyD family efflux transporter periplasmic adaptor subunit [Legionella septentrionalis]RUR15113.1 HlyD fami
MNKNLFRQAVIDNKKLQIYGSVFINTPVQYRNMALAAMLTVILIILFFTFAEFSEKFVVSGYINTSKAVSKVYAKTNGLIIKSYVSQGKEVKKGDALFLIDTALDGLSGHDKEKLLKELQKQKRWVEEEIVYKTQHLQAVKKLLQKHYASLSSFNEKQEELLQLKHKLSLLEIEIFKYRQSQLYCLRAPVDGVIASIMFTPGQYLDVAKPLLKIIPKNSALRAELFIPVKKAGFLQKNTAILIHYDAYPYTRFGTYRAVIDDISASILTDAEEEKPMQVGEPYYKATAKLQQQTVLIYGKEKEIQHGMTLTAVVIGSKRKVWQWILDPLYSYYGALFV